MNCEHFHQLIGMRCEPMDTRDGSEVIAVYSPFTFADGGAIEIFASIDGGFVHLSDEGTTLLHLRSVGLPVSDKRRWTPLKSAIKPYGAALTDDGTFELLASAEQSSVAFARFTSALISVANWEREHIGLPIGAEHFKDEVAMHLRSWRPDLELKPRPTPLLGLSGKKHSFDFHFGAEYVDAISANGNSTGAELRKIIDVKSVPEFADLDVRVVVDDRRDRQAAADEIRILGRVARAWPMTALIAKSMRSTAMN
jgi:hypothetical protein